MGINVWLDDERAEPEGWVRVRWPSEAIELLRTGNVDTISLDHDLGDDTIGTGYDVLTWIEETSFIDKIFVLPKILLHTMNPVAREKMKRTIVSIEKHRAVQITED